MLSGARGARAPHFPALEREESPDSDVKPRKNLWVAQARSTGGALLKERRSQVHNAGFRVLRTDSLVKAMEFFGLTPIP